MRLSIFLPLVALVGIAQHVGAKAMNVVVKTEIPELSNIRIGHPGVWSSVPPFDAVELPPIESNEAGPQSIRTGRRPCNRHSASFKDKAIGLSDAIWQALGFSKSSDESSRGPIFILPVYGPSGHPPPPSEPGHPFRPSPPNEPGHPFRPFPPNEPGHPFHPFPPSEPGHPFPPPPPGARHRHHHHHHHHHHRRPFMHRVHDALMALGPWEGRAVAFVIGCGLGVLLRMLWVMSVLVYRLFKGEREEETQYIAVVCDHYTDLQEPVIPPPPEYLIDEKVGADQA